MSAGDQDPLARAAERAARLRDAPLVEAGARHEGLAAARGDAVVAGEVDGSVVSGGRLHVAPGGRIHGPVDAEEVVVEGVVDGPVRAGRRVEILAGGRILGDLESPRIALSDGGLLRGRCRIAGPPEATPGRGGQSAPATLNLSPAM